MRMNHGIIHQIGQTSSARIRRYISFKRALYVRRTLPSNDKCITSPIRAKVKLHSTQKNRNCKRGGISTSASLRFFVLFDPIRVRERWSASLWMMDDVLAPFIPDDSEGLRTTFIFMLDTISAHRFASARLCRWTERDGETGAGECSHLETKKMLICTTISIVLQLVACVGACHSSRFNLL